MRHLRWIVFEAWEKPMGMWDGTNHTLTAEGFKTVVLDRDYVMSVEEAFCANTHINYTVLITTEGGRYNIKETVASFCSKHLYLDLN